MFPYLILLGLLVPGVIGVVKLVRVIRWRQQPHTTGVVRETRQVAPTGDRTRARTHEVIEYTTADGRSVVAEPFHRHSGVRSRVGTEVEVYYDPADPQRVFAPHTPITEAGVIYLVLGLPLAAFALFGLTRLLG